MLCLRVLFYVIITFVYQNLKGLVDVSKCRCILFVLSTRFYRWLVTALSRAFYKLVLQTFQPQRGCSAAARMTVAVHIVIRPSYKMYCERRTISFSTKTEGENKVIKEKMRKYRKTYMRI